MAAHTAFAYVYVASVKFKWRIRFDAGDRWHVRFYKERRHHFNYATDKDGDECEHGEQDRLAFEYLVPAARAACTACVRGGFSGFVLQEGTLLCRPNQVIGQIGRASCREGA